MTNENFVNAHLEAAVEYIPTKSIVPWETLAVREKWADVKTASKRNRKNPTNTNALKLKMTQNELVHIYLKEHNTYKIRSIRLETLLKINHLG